jgi:hypothetical protein
MIKETGRYRNRTNFDDVMKDLRTLKGGVWITIGYVTGKVVNKTLQNKDVNQFGSDIDQYQEKGTPGYDMLKQWQQGGASRKNEAPVAIMKYTETTYHWQTPGTEKGKYGAYKDGVNKLLEPYGVELGTRNKKPNDNPTEAPAVDNKIYQNKATSSKVAEEYFMVKDGKIYGALNKGAISSLLPKYSVDGEKTLRDLGVQENEIKKFVEQVKNLKYGHLGLIPDKILWISYTVKNAMGKKISKFAINNNFTDNIDGVQINPNVFVNRANKRYEKRFRAMPGDEDNNAPVVHSRQPEYAKMYGESKKRELSLTESDLRRVVTEATKILVGNILSENRRRARKRRI